MQPPMAHQTIRQATEVPALFKHLLGRAKAKARTAIVFPLRSQMDSIRPQNAKALPYMPKRILECAATIALLAASAFAQSPTPVYDDFTALTKGITVGPDHCYFWLRQPGTNDVHTACYVGGVLSKNMVDTIGTTSGSIGKAEGEMDMNAYTVKWCFIAGAFTLSVTLPDGTIPLSRNGTF